MLVLARQQTSRVARIRGTAPSTACTGTSAGYSRGTHHRGRALSLTRQSEDIHGGPDAGYTASTSVRALSPTCQPEDTHGGGLAVQQHRGCALCL